VGKSSIQSELFSGCTHLTTVTIGKSVRLIQQQAFDACKNLTVICFQGNAPSLQALAFTNTHPFTVYYTPGTTGWGSTFDGFPTKLWNPRVITTSASFGTWMGRFGFPIIGTSDLIIVVEACTNLAAPIR
jgi:hypothetical protein